MVNDDTLNPYVIVSFAFGLTLGKRVIAFSIQQQNEVPATFRFV